MRLKETKNNELQWDVPNVGQLDFDVNIELLLSKAKERSIQEYNSWCSVIGTFVMEIEKLKKAQS